ncbi:LpxL/LpxP family acyltransferase [Luteococcus sp. Sow4_B9]|uniref:LpxL/LpxP family acyltransferase n=1 Tax=Luteococcus sp. Sow4_B9 TaxID=3438792 RepID=UPI003F9E3393
MSRTTAALDAVGRTPEAVWRPAVRLGACAAALKPPRGLRQWQANATTLAGHAPGGDLTRRAAQSWARNVMETARLGHWSEEQIRSAVLVDEDALAVLRARHRHGGAVVALPHMGSWDLAGSWACLNGLPVATVAERLPDDEFAWYVGVRSRLGMTVHGHRDGDVLARLTADLQDGRMVCLVSDRKLGPGGTPVHWPTAAGGVEVKMPAGAAHLSLSTGATLFGVACHYEGPRMRMVIGDPVGPRPGAQDPVQDMNQQLADFFGAQALAHLQDWHMMQRFFPGVVAA